MTALRRLKRNLKKSIIQQLTEERILSQKTILEVAKEIQVNPEGLYNAELTGKAEWNLLIKLLRYYNKQITVVLTNQEFS